MRVGDTGMRAHTGVWALQVINTHPRLSDLIDPRIDGLTPGVRVSVREPGCVCGCVRMCMGGYVCVIPQ